MNDALLTLDDLDVGNQRVLLRADLNLSLEPAAAGAPARVADDARIRAALVTIEELRRIRAFRLRAAFSPAQPSFCDA